MHANRASAEEIHVFQKEIADVIKKNDKKGIVTAIQDESIVIAGSRARKRGYTRSGIRASYVYTGSHSKTMCLG